MELVAVENPEMSFLIISVWKACGDYPLLYVICTRKCSLRCSLLDLKQVGKNIVSEIDIYPALSVAVENNLISCLVPLIWRACGDHPLLYVFYTWRC